MELGFKKKMLHQRLRELSPFVLAFSAGKDSAFLLRESLRATGKDAVFAVFVDTPLMTDLDRERLAYFQRRLDCPVLKHRFDPLKTLGVHNNAPDRCYHCKKAIFASLFEMASQKGLPPRVLDGSTFSDTDAYRPGRKAIEELGVFSPLQEVGIGAQEIVKSLGAWGVPARFLLSSSCLATRVPYGEVLVESTMRRIEEMESVWHRLGIFDVRCRIIGEGCRIEVPLRWQRKILVNRELALREGRRLGFKWVALDLETVRSGPWDPQKSEK